MTNEELIATIRNEIERLENYYTSVERHVEALISFLDALESEKPINPDDAMKELDEKIALVKQRGTWDGVDVDKYMDEVRGREPEKPDPNDLEETADNHIRKVADAAGHPGWDWTTQDIADAFIAGAKWQKEQMMDEAVEVCTVVEEGRYCQEIGPLFLDERAGFKPGDKVRIIIVKE